MDVRLELFPERHLFAQTAEEHVGHADLNLRLGHALMAIKVDINLVQVLARHVPVDNKKKKEERGGGRRRRRREKIGKKRSKAKKKDPYQSPIMST